MLISKEMYLFLKDYMKWVKNGAVNDKPYYRSIGLCTAARICKIPNLNLREIRYEFKILFEAEGLNRTYPFGETNFDTRVENKTQHEDPIRLEWIKDHIEEYENALVTT